MSIWGTLIGGMLGFTIGGPIGALLGSFLGSKFSGGKVKTINFSNENSQQIFALALIILSAKISKADGVVTKDELHAIKEKLNIPDSEIDNVSKVFNVAKQDDLGFEPYAQQISQIYSKNKTALVTGGATGIGLAISKELAKEGVKVIFTSRNKQSIKTSDQILKKINSNCYGINCDVTKRSSRFKLFKTFSFPV